MNTHGEVEAADIQRRVLRVADLSGANLEGACLRRANLAEAVMDSADLRGSDLQGANLRKASLYRAILNRADLGGANLGLSDLRYACLENANLCRVNLNQANLLGARLVGARLDHVDLAGAILPDGTQYAEDTDIERFTSLAHPAFEVTLKTVNEINADSSAEKERKSATAENDLSWARFVERTYGSLADDPIEWHPPSYVENEDRRE